jgi:hypothetical protein
MVTQKRISDRIPPRASEKMDARLCRPFGALYYRDPCPRRFRAGLRYFASEGPRRNVNARGKNVQRCSAVSIWARCKRSE